MQNKTDVSRELLYEFLERWSVDKVKKMTLEEYVSVGNKDTFCQWLETKTRDLGSIKGLTSSKFGIYKRKENKDKPKTLVNDSIYSWQKFYGKKRLKAFEEIKSEILQIIEFSEKGAFHKIDDIHLTLFVKWKIAYLYSNERLVPIFKKSVLYKIATNYGLEVNSKTRISDIQELMIKNKPSHLSIYDYSYDLYNKFGGVDSKKKSITKKAKRTIRKAADSRNTSTQSRKGSRSYIANQKHNLLQEKLKSMLEKEYGKNNVILEENYVDVKVTLPDELRFFEVKSSSYASECVKEALGQILSYSHYDNDKRKKILFVAGQYAPNVDEIDYINFVKKSLNISFDYISVPLDE